QGHAADHILPGQHVLGWQRGVGFLRRPFHPVGGTRSGGMWYLQRVGDIEFCMLFLQGQRQKRQL
ncbi:MAG: hypothetical protein EBS01_08590, partial [Verrucomicrobia bacterium]|nr:hypothetical protein [Verrucomicrobiota bacterium]